MVVVYQAIIEPPQLTLFNSVLDWVVAITRRDDKKGREKEESKNKLGIHEEIRSREM